MLSKLYYMLPLLSSANSSQKQKVHKLIMFAARTVIGSYCFKVSCRKILKKVNWLSANQIINWSIIKSIHKIIFHKTLLIYITIKPTDVNVQLSFPKYFLNLKLQGLFTYLKGLNHTILFPMK